MIGGKNAHMNGRAVWSIYRFEMARMRRTLLQSIVAPVLSTSLYFVVFGAAIGGRINQVDGIPYGAFIVPGLVMLSLLTQSISNASFAIYFPKFTGTIFEILSAPVSAAEITLGYVGAAATKSIVLGLIILATAAFIVPIRVDHPVVMIAFLVLTAVSFSLLGFIIGIWADGFEELQFIPLLIVTPLTFLGGSFYSVDMLPSPWSTVALFNPVVYLVSGFRWSFFSLSDVDVRISLAATCGFLGVCLAIVAWIFKTGVPAEALVGAQPSRASASAMCAGTGAVATIAGFFGLSGTAMLRARRCSGSRVAGPYTPSPRSGQPKAAQCTRSWCVRPVTGVSSSHARPPGAAEHAPERPRWLPGRIDAHAPLARIGRAWRNGQIDRALVPVGHTLRHRPVALLDLSLGEQLAETRQGLAVPAEHQATRGVAVEPMRDLRPARQAEAEVVEPARQRVAAATIGVHRQAGRLVDHQHQSVAVQHASHYVVGGHAGGLSGVPGRRKASLGRDGPPE